MDLVGLSILLIFLAVIISASLEKTDKVVAAITGGIAVYLILSIIEGLSFEEITHFIDFRVLLTIFGFMIIVEASKESGIFHFISIRAIKLSRGDPIFLFIILCIMTAILAMFITAMAAIIIIGTLTITISRVLKIDPTPLLLAEAIIVDVGGMLFPFSSIPNIIIAQEAELSVSFFFFNTLPFVLMSLMFSTWFLLRELRMKIGYVDPLRRMLVLEVNEWIFIPDVKIFQKSAVLFISIIIALIVIPQTYLVAIIGALLFLVISGLKVEDVIKGIDWGTLIFFSGIYIIVGAMEHKGLLREAGIFLGKISMGNPILGSLMILWVVGLLSSIVDNVAIAIAFIPIIRAMAETAGLGPLIEIFWLALILGTNLGGNILPYGAPTTILAMGIGHRYGRSFEPREFVKIGSRWGIYNLALATGYLMLRLITSILIELVGLLLLTVIITLAITLLALVIIEKKIGLKAFYRLLKKRYIELKSRIRKLLTHCRKTRTSPY